MFQGPWAKVKPGMSLITVGGVLSELSEAEVDTEVCKQRLEPGRLESSVKGITGRYRLRPGDISRFFVTSA